MRQLAAAGMRRGWKVALAVAVGAGGMAAVDSTGVFASIVNRAQLGAGETFVNQSVSFDTQPGDLASFRTVPAGAYWELQTLRATNCEDQQRAMEFLLADQDGTTQATLSLAAATPVQVPPGGALAWTGSVKVPPGWRVYARWRGMTGGHRCNWQYTAIERATAG